MKISVQLYLENPMAFASIMETLLNGSTTGTLDITHTGALEPAKHKVSLEQIPEAIAPTFKAVCSGCSWEEPTDPHMLHALSVNTVTDFYEMRHRIQLLEQR